MPVETSRNNETPKRDSSRCEEAHQHQAEKLSSNCSALFESFKTKMKSSPARHRKENHRPQCNFLNFRELPHHINTVLALETVLKNYCKNAGLKRSKTGDILYSSNRTEAWLINQTDPNGVEQRADCDASSKPCYAHVYI